MFIRPIRLASLIGRLIRFNEASTSALIVVTISFAPARSTIRLPAKSVISKPGYELPFMSRHVESVLVEFKENYRGLIINSFIVVATCSNEYPPSVLGRCFPVKKSLILCMIT